MSQGSLWVEKKRKNDAIVTSKNYKIRADESTEYVLIETQLIQEFKQIVLKKLNIFLKKTELHINTFTEKKRDRANLQNQTDTVKLETILNEIRIIKETSNTVKVLDRRKNQ